MSLRKHRCAQRHDRVSIDPAQLNLQIGVFLVHLLAVITVLDQERASEPTGTAFFTA